VLGSLALRRSRRGALTHVDVSSTSKSPDEIAQAIVADGVATHCAAGCAVRARGEWKRETGGAVETLFDLASLTKPMAAVAFACAGIDRSLPLAALLPEARGTASERVPLELLLAHRAGLDGHRPLYAPLLRHRPVDVPSSLREAANARLPGALGDPPPAGFAPLYSDLGYILAGEALARTTSARDAGEAIGRLVLEPLHIAQRAGTIRDLATKGIRGPFAPTETVEWRGGPIVGAVHDENAWALTGEGGSGHAGIFGAVDSLLTFGAAVLDAIDASETASETATPAEREDRRAPFGASVDLEWLVRERPGGTLRAGFDGRSAHGSSAGERMGGRTFGHLGFTGTSLWLDPDSKVVVVLLTNRVCKGRDPIAIRESRPKAHDALFESAIFLGQS
jgi:CubicO group peptidase (beta-lactamase class C family)